MYRPRAARSCAPCLIYSTQSNAMADAMPDCIMNGANAKDSFAQLTTACDAEVKSSAASYASMAPREAVVVVAVLALTPAFT